jgi:flagella basal body P-ring formation protein FlgA
MRSILFAILMLPGFALAADFTDHVIESLIAEAWKPLDVRVEWTASGSSKLDLDSLCEYHITSPKPLRLAGNLTLKLVGVDSLNRENAVVTKGTAKIFGKSFSPLHYISAGDSVKAEQLASIEMEWTRLHEQPLIQIDNEETYRAARGLVPGRPICEHDLKLAPVVMKNRQVTLQMINDNVTIGLIGHALEDGAVGDEIMVRVELEQSKRYRGVVVDENTVRFIQ